MYICPIYNVDGADEEMKEKWEHLRVNKNTKKDSLADTSELKLHRLSQSVDLI